MAKTTSLLALALAVLAPASAYADSHTSSTDGRGSSVPAAREQSVHRAANGWREDSTLQRGGGPGTTAESQSAPPASSEDRAAQLHRASPHVVAAQTELDVARAYSRAIDRTAALESSPMSGAYREQVRQFAG